MQLCACGFCRKCDAMRKSGLCCLAVLGACISVMFVETANNTTIVAMECEWESVSIELSNGTTFNDIEQPVPKFQGHANIRR